MPGPAYTTAPLRPVTYNGRTFRARRPEGVVRAALRDVEANAKPLTEIAQAAGVDVGVLKTWRRLAGLPVDPVAGRRRQAARGGADDEARAAAVRLYVGPPQRSLAEVAAVLAPLSKTFVRLACIEAGVLRPARSGHLRGRFVSLRGRRRADRVRAICKRVVDLRFAGDPGPKVRTAREFGVTKATVQQALASPLNPYPPTAYNGRGRANLPPLPADK